MLKCKLILLLTFSLLNAALSSTEQGSIDVSPSELPINATERVKEESGDYKAWMYDAANPYTDDPRYENAKVCRSHANWQFVTKNWSAMAEQLEPNCTHLYGNLVLAGINDDDDLNLLDQLEDISGYLAIYGVGRKHLKLPKLKIIRGFDYLDLKSQKVVLFVSKNYKKQLVVDEDDEGLNSRPPTHHPTKSVDAKDTGTSNGCGLDRDSSHCAYWQSSSKYEMTFMRILELPSLISIMNHGVYFYDNPGLCHAPQTINWVDLLENSELQQVVRVDADDERDMYNSCIYYHLTTVSSAINKDLQMKTSRPTFLRHSRLRAGRSVDTVDLSDDEQQQSSALQNNADEQEVNTTKDNANNSIEVSPTILQNTAHANKISTTPGQPTISLSPMNKALEEEDSEVLESSEATSTSSDGSTACSSTDYCEPSNLFNDVPELLDTRAKYVGLPKHDSIQSNQYGSVAVKKEDGDSFTDLRSPQQPPADINNSPEDATFTSNTSTSPSVPLSTTSTDGNKHAGIDANVSKQAKENKILTNVGVGNQQKIGMENQVESEQTTSLIREQSTSTASPSTTTPTVTSTTESSSTKQSSTKEPTTTPVPMMSSTSLSSSSISSTAKPSDADKAWNYLTSLTNSPTHQSNQSTPQPSNERWERFCHWSCPHIQGRRYCWGPERSQCQAIHKCQNRLCDGSNWCYRPNGEVSRSSNGLGTTQEYCCHSECAAGCTGPKASECRACSRYSNKGVCTPQCPSVKIYNKTTFMWTDNPDGRYTFASHCVKTCPAGYLRDGQYCVRECNRATMYAIDGQCLPCPNGICPKVCSMQSIESKPGIDYLHRRALRAMRDCTSFVGDLKLSPFSFQGDSFYNLTQESDGVRWPDLVDGLSKLQLITGSIYISSGNSADWFKNLTFLASLKVIGSRPKTPQGWAININGNEHLEFLGLTSLEYIFPHKILISRNSRLCLADQLDWSYLFVSRRQFKVDATSSENSVTSSLTGESSQSETMTNSATIDTDDNSLSIYQNAPEESCTTRGMLCSDECRPEFGCWGPAPDRCLRCRAWTIQLGMRCVASCEAEIGYFTPRQVSLPSNEAEPVTEINSLLDDQSTSVSQSTLSSTTDALVTAQVITADEPRYCGVCSSNCARQWAACYGPGSHQCNGPCRWVKDGPYCRRSCPSGKFTDPQTGVCKSCAGVCSLPHHRPGALTMTIAAMNEPLSVTMKMSQVDGDDVTDEQAIQAAACTGSGDWPGPSGCLFCRNIRLKPTVDKKDKEDKEDSQGSHLQCVEKCPSGTYLHALNLHNRGGSSSRRLMRYSPDKPPWGRADAVLLQHLSEKVKTEVAVWLFNHTQPELYGMAGICLPCNSQCWSLDQQKDLSVAGVAIDSAEVDQQQGIRMVKGPLCYGPGPDQCTRCKNASLEQGRCVEKCPIKTYVVKVEKDETDAHSKFICKSCHVQCEDGCDGPEASQCHRCHTVKVYESSAMDKWTCSNRCPDRNKYQAMDPSTGEWVCSAFIDAIHIVSSASIESQSSNNLSSVSNQSQLLHPSGLTFHEFEVFKARGKQMTGDQAALITALIISGVILVGLVLIVVGTLVSQRRQDELGYKSKYFEDNFAEPFDYTEEDLIDLEQMSCCELFWFQGQPELARRKRWAKELVAKRQRQQEAQLALLNKNGINGVAGESMSNSQLEPNMASLRIVSESELRRGPLIGSGAFGTVYCGLWTPQLPSPVKRDDGLVTSAEEGIKVDLTAANGDRHHLMDRSNDHSWLTRPLLEGGDNESGRATLTSIISDKTNGSSSINSIPVAIKVLNELGDHRTNKEMLDEAELMASVNHKCCVRLFGLCLTARLQLVAEFMPLGSLLDFIRTCREYATPKTILAWAGQIAEGMAYLASRGIIHRDLAARNVLVESIQQVRITDFGLAKYLDVIGSEYRGTGGRLPIKWTALESIKERIFSTKSDVWSYGVTLWELLTFGDRPYESVRARDLITNLESGMRLPQPETASVDLYLVLLRCWLADPNQRPDFNELNVIIGQMKATASQYVFILPSVQNVTPRCTLKSASALEFLTSSLSAATFTSNSSSSATERSTSLVSSIVNDPSSTSDDKTLNPSTPTPTHDLDNRLPLKQKDTEKSTNQQTEYTQIQVDWLRNLYVNSQLTRFPDCVESFLANYQYIALTRHQPTTTNTESNDRYYKVLVVQSNCDEADRLSVGQDTTNQHNGHQGSINGYSNLDNVPDTKPSTNRPDHSEDPVPRIPRQEAGTCTNEFNYLSARLPPLYENCNQLALDEAEQRVGLLMEMTERGSN